MSRVSVFLQSIFVSPRILLHTFRRYVNLSFLAFAGNRQLWARQAPVSWGRGSKKVLRARRGAGGELDCPGPVLLGFVTGPAPVGSWGMDGSSAGGACQGTEMSCVVTLGGSVWSFYPMEEELGSWEWRGWEVLF